MENERLRCHVSGCANECTHAAPGAESDPYSVEYFCNECHAKMGRVPSEVWPWKLDLSEKEITALIESAPFVGPELAAV